MTSSKSSWGRILAKKGEKKLKNGIEFKWMKKKNLCKHYERQLHNIIMRDLINKKRQLHSKIYYVIVSFCLLLRNFINYFFCNYYVFFEFM